jgi:two-component system response regulator YesN
VIRKNRNRARKYTEKLFNAFLAMGLVLIGFTGTLVSLVSIHSLRANEIESGQKLLTQFSNSVDTTLSYINTIMLNYSSNRKFRSFLRYYKAMDVDSLIDVSNQLEDMIANNSYIHSIIFYYPQDQLAYVANSGVMPVDSCFDGAFLTSIDPAGASVPGTSSRTVWDSQKQTGVSLLSLMRPLQYAGGELESLLIINLDTSFFSDMFNSVGEGENAFFALNEDALTVTGSDNCAGYAGYFPQIFERLSESGSIEFSMENEQFLISCVSSPGTGWRYYSITSTAVIYKEVRALLILSVLILSSGIAMAVLCSEIISRRLSRPILKVARQFDQPLQANDDILHHIETNIDHLKQENKSIRESLDESLPVLKNNFVISLLGGYVVRPDEIDKNFSYFGIGLSRTGPVFVCVIKLNELNASTGEHYLPLQIHSLTAMVTDLLAEEFSDSGSYLFCNSYEEEITVICALTGQENAGDRTGHVLALLVQLFKNIKKYITRIGIGSIEQNIYNISLSYRNAKKALALGFLSSEQIICYDDIPSLSALSDQIEGYPYKLESELIAAVRANTGIEECLASIIGTILSVTGRDKSKRSYFLLQLYHRLLKYAYDANITEDINRTDQCAELLSLPEDQLFSWFDAYIKSVITQILYKKANPDNQLSERIKAYIEKNYDQDISIPLLAEVFLFSPTHMSHLFHEQTGSSIKQYLIRVRIEKACELLRDGSLKIADIGQMTGYPKPHGFLKQFKSYTGMTPSEFRQQLAEGRTENTFFPLDES